MKTISVKKLSDRDIVLNVIGEFYDKYSACEVVVKTLQESLTDQQRKLYFTWMGIIGADLGNSKDEQHQQMKEKFLLKIYIADPENHPEFVGVVDNMQIVRLQCPEQFPALRKLVFGGLSIMDATKKNMIDLLREVEALARSLDIRLPAPERKGMI